MSSSSEGLGSRTPLLKDIAEDETLEVVSVEDIDDELDDPLTRSELERGLLWKLDKRMSILVLIYILNFVRNTFSAFRVIFNLRDIDRP